MPKSTSFLHCHAVYLSPLPQTLLTSAACLAPTILSRDPPSFVRASLPTHPTLCRVCTPVSLGRPRYHIPQCLLYDSTSSSADIFLLYMTERDAGICLPASPFQQLACFWRFRLQRINSSILSIKLLRTPLIYGSPHREP